MDTSSPVTQQPQSVSLEQGYFNEPSNNEQLTSLKRRLTQYWEKIYYFARQIWPWVNRLINFVVYEIIKVLKAIVKIALSQIGLMKN